MHGILLIQVGPITQHYDLSLAISQSVSYVFHEFLYKVYYTYMQSSNSTILQALSFSNDSNVFFFHVHANEIYASSITLPFN